MSFSHEAVKELDRACDRYRERLEKVARIIAGKTGEHTITSDYVKLAEKSMR